MKKNGFLFASFFFLLLGCGGPLDEGYWKDYNKKAELNPGDGDEREFTIKFDSLHTNIDFDFSDHKLIRLNRERISFSVRINHPAVITNFAFRLRSNPCPGPTNIHNYPNADTETPLIRNNVTLNTVSDDINSNLENQYVYLTAEIAAGTRVDVACSDIRL